jgi:hypothetical protein
MILQELCAARGVEYFGPVAKRGLSSGKPSEDLVQAQYSRFEKKWGAALDGQRERRAEAAVL